jgi:GTP pyrophosphokinase
MVAIKQKFSRHADGSIDLDLWLQHIKTTTNNISLIEKALLLADKTSKGLTNSYGQPVIEQSLEIAELLLDLKLDQEAVAAAIIISALQHAPITPETIEEQLGTTVAKLVKYVAQINAIYASQTNINKARTLTQIDRLRKTFLAMASDIRAVLIKLAERTVMMRGIKNINPTERKRLAQETLDIYAPLANRLGIGQLKWELEDIALHYTDPDTYKTIANFLAERRVDREKHIHEIIASLKESFTKSHLQAHISGRAKHIYSIYLKMQRKDFDYKNIYDYNAVRILVPTLDDCYTALSVVHNLWERIPEEFDDYIANPKPNGYRSIHTAVIGPDGKNLEIQIRTEAMHKEAEHGVAAHWLYKEKDNTVSNYEEKITYLRQLVAWHKEIAEQDTQPDKSLEDILKDSAYVFTPAGDIIDLPAGATPLDFAYHVHSEIGHRCRGAKVNGHIVPLTHTLKTGDRVDIMTSPHGTPSRDWLKKDSGYLKTARARAKVSQWFRHQETHTPPARAAHHQEPPTRTPVATTTTQSLRKERPKTSGFHIAGVDDLLTRIAHCCKPIPGDAIIGYITQGRGVSIHRNDCNNITYQTQLSSSKDRLIQVSWDAESPSAYYVDLEIHAQGSEDVLKEITATLANAEINLLALNSSLNRKSNHMLVTITVQLNSVDQLKKLLSQISQLPYVTHTKRTGE